MSSLFNAPSKCPKFSTCNAPICPLDRDWYLRINRNKDSVCYYLIESVKDDAEARFDRAQLGNMFKLIVMTRVAICKHFKRIARKLHMASKTSSRMERRFKS